jgi:hypothetical protein
MTQEQIEQMVLDYRMTDCKKQDGTRGIMFFPHEKGEALENLKKEIAAAKPELLAEIDRQKTEKAEQARLDAAKRENSVTVFLSSRGWGDYSNLEISIDTRNFDLKTEIEKAKKALKNGYDVDNPNQSDEEISDKITEAVSKFLAKKEAKETKKAKYEKELNEALKTVNKSYNQIYSEMKKQRTIYNNVQNEGGDGYIPDCYEDILKFLQKFYLQK